MEEILINLAGAILPTLLQKYAPTLAPFVSDVVKVIKKGTGPAAPVAGAPVAPGAKPSEFVRTGQRLLNQYLKLSPPLAEDGWLGTKTEKAIADALAPYGIVLPVDA